MKVQARTSRRGTYERLCIIRIFTEDMWTGVRRIVRKCVYGIECDCIFEVEQLREMFVDLYK